MYSHCSQQSIHILYSLFYFSYQTRTLLISLTQLHIFLLLYRSSLCFSSNFRIFPFQGTTKAVEWYSHRENCPQFISVSQNTIFVAHCILMCVLHKYVIHVGKRIGYGDIVFLHVRKFDIRTLSYLSHIFFHC